MGSVDTTPISPIRVYYAVITAIHGGLEGDCASLTFDAHGFASWDQSVTFPVSNLPAANLLSCDIKNKAPVVGDACEIWVMPNSTVKLFLKTHSLIFKDCP